MIYPKFIKQGDIICVPAPSDGAYCEEYVRRYKNAKSNLEKRGYKVELSENIFHSKKGRSSDAISRAEEYHKSLEENLEILSGNLIKQDSYDMFENERAERVTGLEGYNLTDKVYWKTINNEEVTMQGRIIGGCIDIITELAGTRFDGVKEFNEKYKDDGIIWYFDNCELSKESLMRTLWKFNELGYFKYTKGIIFGRNGQEVSYNYDTMEDAIKDSVLSKLNVPIIFDADISHKGPSMTIINGAIATINCKDGKGNITFELK